MRPQLLVLSLTALTIGSAAVRADSISVNYTPLKFGSVIQEQPSTNSDPLGDKLIFNIPGRKKPVIVDHGLDLPTFFNPGHDPTYRPINADQYKKDMYALTMVAAGIEAKIIRDVPEKLKGELFREWLYSQTTIVENSACLNKNVRDKLFEMARQSIKPPPPYPVRTDVGGRVSTEK